MARHRVANRLAHNETDQGRLGAILPGPHVENEGGTRGPTSPPNGSSEVGAPAHPMSRGQHRSGSETVAALAAARRKDGAAGAGAHPKPKAMSLGPTPVVGLEGTLRHKRLRGLTGGQGGGSPRWAGQGFRSRNEHHTCWPKVRPATPYGTTPGRGWVKPGDLDPSTEPNDCPARATFQCFKCWCGGGGDTPIIARYGGS